METKIKRSWMIAAALAVCLISAVPGIFFYRQGIFEEEATQQARESVHRWTLDEIDQVMRERYGEGIVRISGEEMPENSEFSESEPGQKSKVLTVIYSAPSVREAAEDFYFQVRGTSELEDNFLYQLMKSDALRFWENRNRWFGLYAWTSWGQEDQFYEPQDERWDTRKYPGEKDQLCVSCYFRRDAADCAGDIADWLYYAAQDKRYQAERGREDRSNDPFRKIWIQTSLGRFQLDLSSVTDRLGEASWEETYREIEALLYECGDQCGMWDESGTEEEGSDGSVASSGAEASESDPEDEEKEWAENFLAQYRGDYEQEYALEEEGILFRMVVLDAAAGSRWYGLLKSSDGGSSWQVVSSSPFGGDMGGGVEFTFLSEDFGFAALMHNGGDEAVLYVTEDGGQSYQPVVMQGTNVTLENGYFYNPYDFPQMPYEEEGRLWVRCGQGMDGDYGGGDEAGLALFESTDRGHTFVFKGITKP